MRFTFNPDAEEFIPKAEKEHRHNGERNGCSSERGEAGDRAGKQTPRQRGRVCRGWGGVGRLNPDIEHQGMHRARKRGASVDRDRRESSEKIQ